MRTVRAVNGVFETDTGRLIGLTQSGSSDVTYIPGSDAAYSDLQASSACRFFIPSRQPVGSGAAKDYSGKGNDMVLKAGFVDDGTGPWATDGFFTSKAGTTGLASLATAQSGAFDLATQSVIFSCSLKKAAPAGNEAICGNADGAAANGFYLSVRGAGGKIRPILNTSAGLVSGLADSALTFADNVTHELMLAIDGPAKAVYLYRDGWLSNAYLLAFTGGTPNITARFALGSQNEAASLTYDAQWANAQLYVFNGSLPSNLNMVAQRLSAIPGKALTDSELALS